MTPPQQQQQQQEAELHDEVEIQSLSECGSDAGQEIESEIESEYDDDNPMISQTGLAIADIALEMAEDLSAISGALYTSQGETIADVLAGIRTALNQINKIVYNKM
jgi:hypothetical protein